MSASADIEPLRGERLFEPFLDPVDGALCVEAGVPLSEVAREAASGGMRFPLVLDANASLAKHLEAAWYAPASHRFGSFCDNVLGMNWRLPDGRTLRVGERVAKTTTGYDWLRFLLHTGTRFGEATHYVIRLRPECAFSAVAFLEGGGDPLRACVSELLHGAWMHWWESIDFLPGAPGGPSETGGTLRVGVHCPLNEAPAFEAELRRVASVHSLSVRWEAATPVPHAGVPDFALKTTPDRAMRLAADVARNGAERVVAFCYHGVVHGCLGPGQNVADVIAPFEAALWEVGGDWHSRHPVLPRLQQAEACWMKVLEPVLRGMEEVHHGSF
jgi:FAD/FMN-containing dehydrogenase